MARRSLAAVVLTLSFVLTAATTVVARDFTPGAPGLGDPYLPMDGNGGYDVRTYVLDLRYDPGTDVLEGQATIKARTTQALSSFNLDFDGLTVDAITVNGAAATWHREDGELTVVPASGLPANSRFTVVVTYHGVPEPFEDGTGWLTTDDGALVSGQPHGATTWFPANDHPSDRAEFTFRVYVPTGVEVVANGVLDGVRQHGDWTLWVWDQHHPMATYLAGMMIGELEFTQYRHEGIRFWDAVDPDLYAPVAQPTTGAQLAISQQGDAAYKRLMRTITVPAGGATLSFTVTRQTEGFFDFFLVEAHTPGEDDWTTLPDQEGHASQETGGACPFWFEYHPFLTHYLSPPDNEFEPCAPTGDTGEWWAASGSSDGPETWTVDLSAWAGSQVEVALTYVTDDVVQANGVFVDDIVVSTGEGSTSFEDDGDVFDGWTVPGAPEGSPGNETDWIAGTVDDLPPPLGQKIDSVFGRQVEMIEWLESYLGPYPFYAGGGMVDDVDLPYALALEVHSRSLYSPSAFHDVAGAEPVVVHELAHQWFGNSATLAEWQHIWLNEGFATYFEWLWADREGYFPIEEVVSFLASVPAEEPFWSVVIGDPGPDLMFDIAVYYRGALTLHFLRQEVGDEAFFEILAQWAQSQAGDLVTTDEFIELAERVSGQELDAFFDVWLFSGTKPPALGEGDVEPEISSFGREPSRGESSKSPVGLEHRRR